MRKFQEDTGIQKTTMQNYLSKLKKFFFYIELHASYRFSNYKKHPWDKILDGVRARIQQGAQKHKKRRIRELQKKVPTLDQVQNVNAMVVEFLQKDLEQKFLEYKELAALNFLVLSFRLNCRSGPILNLNWYHVHCIKKNGYLETDHHKTGSHYDVTLKIEDDQHLWLKRMRKQFIKEFRISPTLVFPTSCNTVDHSMARTIRVVLGNLFHGPDVQKDFHATAVRKMWDTHFYRNKDSLGDKFTAHFEQTGHSEATALRSYVVPGDRMETLQIYLEQLSALDEAPTKTSSTTASRTASNTLSKTPSETT